MTYSFPISVRLPATSALGSTSPTRVSVSQSGKRNVRSNASQRYSCKLTWANLTVAESRVISAFVEQLRGQFSNFTMTLPDYKTPLGTWSGVPVVNGANQTGYTLNLRGLTASQTGIARAGDILNIGTDPKVYRVAADTNSDGSGHAALTLVQALMASPPDGATIVSTNVLFTFAAGADLFEQPVVPGMIYNLALNVVEDV